MSSLRLPAVVLFLVWELLGEVRSAEPDPARWADVVQSFEAEDAGSAKPENGIVFTGSSSIALWRTIHEDMAPFAVIHRGFGGSTMRDLLYWLDVLVLKHRSRAVVLYEGDNDIWQYNVSAEELFDDFKEFVSRVHAELPETRIYFISIKPSIHRWGGWPEMRHANRLIRDYCKGRPRLHFIDVAPLMLDEFGRPRSEIFQPDGVHMNARGYDLWSFAIKTALLEHERICK